MGGKGQDRILGLPGNALLRGARSVGHTAQRRHRELRWRIPVGPRCHLGQRAEARALPRLVGLGLAF